MGGIKYDSGKEVYYPGTTIPVNLQNIKDEETIEELELELLEKGYEYFHTHLFENTVFDEQYLCELQEKTFSHLYLWAGKYRTVNISKGTTLFCPAAHLHQYSNEIFTALKAENYLRDFRNKETSEFSKRMAYYMGELIVLHPFYELNGRTIRLFFDMIAVVNGYEYIDYSSLDFETGENLFITASKACMNKDYSLLESIIFSGLWRVDVDKMP